MQNELTIVGIQADLIWENPFENRRQFEHIIDQLSGEVDLIVLPEMFSTGFTMNASMVAEKMNGETIGWMQKIAKKKNMALCGSLVISEADNFYNRFVFVHPSGEIETYNKRHSFSLAGEDKVYTAGNEQRIITYKGWKICPLICYDLRFPVWSRNTQNYDLILFMANWPVTRVHAWDVLLKARAIENMSFTIGVNRVGLDANQYKYVGHSAIIDFLGHETAFLQANEIGVVSATLNKADQDATRKKLGFLLDKDSFTIQ
jgi:predicted amidohydrolase